MTEIYIISAVRTPIGRCGGAFAEITAPALGATAIRGALERADVKGEDVDEVFMGNVLQAGQGQAPARQAALAAGVSRHAPATTINKVCGSGLEAIILGVQGIMMGHCHIVVAGGMENMSTVPNAIDRSGNPASMVNLVVKDGLTDASSGQHMGRCMDLFARETGISREQQDDLAVLSYRRSHDAICKGYFQSEIVEVATSRAAASTISEDEGPSIFDEEKLRRLTPAFGPDGTVTAGNASSINDGAAALVLASEAAVRRLGLVPRGRIVSFAAAADHPKNFATAPIQATELALKRARLKLDDIDFFEVNEAFAATTCLIADRLALPMERVNPFGGAVSLGHPIGATGARLVTTLLNVLKTKNGRWGLATLCVGGGEGIAMIVERL